MEQLRDIGRIVSELKRCRPPSDLQCALVIGAGCSASANVPLTEDLVKRIRVDYPNAYDRADPKDYIHCMQEMTIADRQDLIRDAFSKAPRINAAHLAIAQLVKSEVVRCVLTTNFDSLIVRACTFLGLEPAIYDFAALDSDYFSTRPVSEGPAVIHLHGQHFGLVQVNVPEEFTHNSRVYNRLFDHLDNDCVWILLGFSGRDNPTIEQLCQRPNFLHGLYWVAHGEKLPEPNILGTLDQPGKGAFLVLGYDADGFFTSLARGLDCAQPKALSAPLSYVRDLVDRLVLPDEWSKTAAGLERETADSLQRSITLIHRLQSLVEGKGLPFLPEEELGTLAPAAGLILNLPLYNGREGGYGSPAELVESRDQPDFRARALQSNWGPLMVAVQYHAAKLRYCSIVCSAQVRQDFDLAAQLIALFAPNTKCSAVNLRDPNSILEVQRQIGDTYDTFTREEGLGPKDIVADITSGNSVMTAGIVLATLDDERAIEYLRQDPPLTGKDSEGNLTALTPDQIHERQILIGIRTSAAMVRRAMFGKVAPYELRATPDEDGVAAAPGPQVQESI